MEGGNKTKYHVVFVPFPAQSHIKCMLKLARLLHHKGLHITFVNTEFSHKRLLESGGPHSLDGAPGFRFETISDGFVCKHGSNIVDVTEMDELYNSLRTNCLAPFLDLVARLETHVTCIISDAFMPFPIDAAQKLQVPILQFWTFAATGFMGFYQVPNLAEKEVFPPKDGSCFTNGNLDTVIDGIPGLEGFRLKDLACSRYTNLNEPGYTYLSACLKATQKIQHIILHTFQELEPNVIKAIEPIFPKVYTVGPLQLLLNHLSSADEANKFDSSGCYMSFWKEEPECVKWLQSKEPNSVVYVNFGSIAVMSKQELMEFGYGLVNSNHYFLWIIRPDLVLGESGVLPPEFQEMVKKRGFIGSWCSQEEVLNHPSVGGFLTHCGWGSTIESLSAGVPMICRPFRGDQLTNCRQICKEWRVGMEIGSRVNRDEVEKVVRELMDGIEGKRMRNKATEWKKMAEIATGSNGSSYLNVEKLANDIIMLSSD
ncbi:UDP-glycosyltransferase 85C2-like [Cynara cardunculus var. scolymus]|uniref:UDP-glycosyltransferase 85C2-like n=1 Tax=Cynara cardunculus var. scolymus TaxID=59895 RepID=UPI000D6232B5|nr:UDP-glycosyltransferase 85C2-like [Cynara cardunculus var. scolymus]